jgi:hypothetical protein
MGVAIVQRDEQWMRRSEEAPEVEMFDMGSREVGQNIVHID